MDNGLKKEAAEILRRYLMINTTNPPGGEIEAAKFLNGIFEKEGIPCVIRESSPGRANLVARLKGNGNRRPLMFLNHMDVVGVEPAHWSVDPFGGDMHDGCIWGRGALDMKGMAVMQLAAVINAGRSGVPLSRDLIFCAAADEEMCGDFGAKWLIENHPEDVDAEFIVNEGSFGINDFPGLPCDVFPCATAEKGPLWLEVSFSGSAGHGSMPPDDHAAHMLLTSLARLINSRQKPRMSPEVERLLLDIGMRSGVPSVLVRNMGRLSPVVSRILVHDPTMRAMLTNTMSVNMIGCGQKENVVPAEASAVIDCRLLPGVDPDEFVARVRSCMKGVEIRVLHSESGTSSPMDTEFFDAFEKAVESVYPGALFTSNLSAGFTDSRFFRRRGAVAYGLVPVSIPRGDIGLVHGHDERIRVDDFERGIDVLEDLVGRLCR